MIAGATRITSARHPAHAATQWSLGGLVLVLVAWVGGCGDEPTPATAESAADAGAGPTIPVTDAAGIVPGQEQGGTPAADSGVSDATVPQDAAVPRAMDAQQPPVASGPDSSVTLPATRRSLIEPDRWEVLQAEDDPFDDRPLDPSCAVEGVSVELLMGEYTFEVDTGMCSYVTAAQTTLHDVAAGESLKARVWHYSLAGPPGNQAHVVLQVGDRVVVEEMLPIPGPGGLSAIEVPLDEALPAGTPVYFHVHNHGDNTYAMIELTGGPPLSGPS